MSMTFYRLSCIFLFYAVIGWITEEIFALLKHGKLVNRGFLKGPVCPIYGFGMVIIAGCLTPVKDYLLLLFIGSVILTTTLELVTGYILERFFKTKWWDYSGNHFNYKGYICLSFSILWGLACVFVIDIIQPIIMNFIDNIVPLKVGVTVIISAAVIMSADFVTTLISMIDMSRSIVKFDELQEKLEKAQQALEETLRGKQAELEEVIREKQEERDERREARRMEQTEQIAQIKEKLMAMSNETRRKHSRFFDAFPDFEHGRRFSEFKAAFEEYRSKNSK